MHDKSFRSGKMVGLFLIVLCVFLSNIDFSSCQQSSYLYQAYIWVDRGCGSSYSDGDPITICYMIESISTCSGGSQPLPEGPEPTPEGPVFPVIQDGQQYCIPRPEESPEPSPTPSPPPLPDYSSVASVTLIDYPPNSACPRYLIQNGTRFINTICCHYGTVTCDSGGGIKTIELIAEIETMTERYVVRSTCSFYVTCGQASSSEITGSSQPVSQNPPANPAPVCHDYDSDGYTNCEGDCNDYDSTVYPGAEDLCDGIDNDCDRKIDEDCPQSFITVELSPGSVSIEEPTNISGVLSPSRAADIHLVFTTPGSNTFTTVVKSNEEGIFSYSFLPGSIGAWSVVASAEGSLNYRTATSDRAFFSVKKIATSLSVHVNSQLLYPAEEIRISGAISPAIATYITVTIKDEKGYEKETVVSSLSDGTFSLFHNPESVGTWSVSAAFDGSEKYESSSSGTVFFTVTKEESALSLSVSSENEKIMEGNTVEITGQIRPQRSTTLFIYLKTDTGDELSFQVQSDKNGTFSHYFIPESAGNWSAYAYVPEEAAYTDVKSDVFLFPVEPAIPDLALSNVVVDSPSVEPDEKVRIHFEIENLGTGTAEKVIIRVTACSATDERIVHNEEIEEISVGGWMSRDVDWPACSGVERIIVELDPSDHIQELREDNNDTAQEMDIRFKRDVSVTGIYFSPEVIQEGETVTITAHIQCVGEVPVCRIEFWEENPGTTSTVTMVLTDLSGGASVEIPWTFKAGDHTIHVDADPQNDIPEFNEDNNRVESDVTVGEVPFPLAETALLISAVTSAGAYWYLKNTARSLSRSGKQIPRKISQTFPGPGEHLSHGARVPTGVEPGQPLGPHLDPSKYYPYVCKAKELLIRAGKATAATEIGAKLYRSLYNKYYHWDKAQRIDFEEIAQRKLNLLDKVITHLFIFGGYIDTEEFCGFFNVDEAELLEVLDFLQKNGYIERVIS